MAGLVDTPEPSSNTGMIATVPSATTYQVISLHQRKSLVLPAI